nr:diguanylate cyclase [Salidesulfovibrio brasiliensis]
MPRQVTSSFGVALRGPGETPDDLIKRTDEALYEAKETGRNKVVIG